MNYEAFLYERGVKPNSVFVYMRTLKTICNYAKKDGIVKDNYNPFKEFSFSKFRNIKTKKRAITKAEIIKITNLELEPNTSLWNSRAYFLFSYYCRGINFIDIAFLRWSDIKDNRLVYTRKKTKELFNISILDPALDILKYYEEIKNADGSNYIFPILSKNNKTPKSMDNRIHKVLKATNKDLGTLGEMVGLNQKLTTYVARHSFATILKKEGIPTAIISEALGHNSEKTTQIYLESFENEVIDNAVKSIL